MDMFRVSRILASEGVPEIFSIMGGCCGHLREAFYGQGRESRDIDGVKAFFFFSFFLYYSKTAKTFRRGRWYDMI